MTQIPKRYLLAATLALLAGSHGSHANQLPFNSKCTFDWDDNPASDNVSNYVLEWTGPSGSHGSYSTTESEASCADAGIDTSIPGEHSAIVRAVNSFGTSGPSDPVVFEFGPQPGAPGRLKIRIIIEVSR